MEILLIGNGFDLEHELPTTYKDFLEFCKRSRKIYTLIETVDPNEYQRDNLDKWKMDCSIKSALLSAFEGRKCSKILHEDGTYDVEVSTSNELLNELYSHLQNNTWLNYFLKCSSYIGENWIDFETEISRVVQALDSARSLFECGGAITDVKQSQSKILASIWNASKKNLSFAFQDADSIDRFSRFLGNELDRLIRALEIYIAGFVQSIDIVKKSTDIENLNPDHVLSFNYSGTYERVYGGEKNIVYDYIHGKADLNQNIRTSNLVLGIDEYLDDAHKDKDLMCLPFKKYYQRIYKSADNSYLDWIDEIKDGYAEYLRKVDIAYAGVPDPIYSLPWKKRYYIGLSSIECPRHNLYIFGHSLDVTDKDILKLFICNDNVQTKIFYYRKNKDDKASLGKLIKNLIQIIGQEELLRRTGGTHKTIEFVPQALHEDDT